MDEIEQLRTKVEELECELEIYKQYWSLASLVLGDEKSDGVMKAVNLSALTP